MCTRCQREPQNWQYKNKCFADSILPHPETQSWDSRGIIPRRNKLSLVENLLRISRQANKETFNGASLCQMKSDTVV